MCFVCGRTGEQKMDLRIDHIEYTAPIFAEELIDDPLEELIRSYEKLYRRTSNLRKELNEQIG